MKWLTVSCEGSSLITFIKKAKEAKALNPSPGDGSPSSLSIVVPVQKLRSGPGAQALLDVWFGSPIILPEGYRYVVLMGCASTLLVGWQCRKVVKAGWDCKVASPLTLSKSSRTFMSAYRELISTLEIYPQVLFLLLTGGLEMPYVASTGGLIWIIGRFMHAQESYSGGSGRRANASFFIASVGNLIVGLAALRCGLRRLF